MTGAGSRYVKVSFTMDRVKSAVHVARFSGREAISELYGFSVTFATDSSELALADVVGRHAVLTIASESGTRYVHGMVCHLEQRESGDDLTLYQAELVPDAWRLLHSRDCRIFQARSIRGIISGLLQEAGVRFDFRQGKPAPVERDYCVQYREPTWSFINRLLAEEGFCYFFLHRQGQHRLQIANDWQVHPFIEKPRTVPFHGPDTTMAAEEQIFRLYFDEGLRAGRVTLGDFNFEKPSLSLLQGAREGQAPLEVYDYPGRYELPEQGQQRARLRLQAARATRHSGTGLSDCTRLAAGQVFTLDGHPRKSLNAESYVLTAVEHQGQKASSDLDIGAQSQRFNYSNAFQCIPRKTPFRPPLRYPKPQVRGAQTATVEGPESEEIYTDEYGRVKVRFHWDRGDEQQGQQGFQGRTCWIWVSQPWDMAWVPRVGHEVIVDFLEGDPDRPLITGRVHHARDLPPFALPQNKTKSGIKTSSTPGGEGFNELSFEDRKDAEQVYLHAQRDLRQDVRNDVTLKVGGKQRETIKGDAAHVVTDGNYEQKVQKGKARVTVQGDIDIQSQKSVIALTAHSEVKVTVGSSTLTLDRSGNIQVSGKNLTLSADSKLTLQSGPGSIKLDRTGTVVIDAVKLAASGKATVELKGALVKIN